MRKKSNTPVIVEEREALPKETLSFPRSLIPKKVWDAWDQSGRNWFQVTADGSVIPVSEEDFGVEGWMNESYGQVTLEYLCDWKVVKGKAVPTNIRYEHHVRHNGAVHNIDGHIAGTPSGFSIMIRRHPDDERVQIGTMREYRPALHDRFMIREDGTYLNRLGEEETYVAQPEDFGEALYDGLSVDEVIEENRVKGESFADAEKRLEEDGTLTVDREGFVVDRVVFRPGITVEGGTGGWGKKGKAAIDTAFREELEEAGVRVIQRGGIFASGDRSWETPANDGHFWGDMTKVVEYEAQNLDPNEMINPEIMWTDISKFDWNLMPDVHLLTCALSAISDLNLISDHPLDES